MRFFSRDGIDPMRQIKWKVTPADVSVMAMKNGEVEASLLEDQFARKFLDDGTLRTLRSLTYDEDCKDETCCIHVVNLDFLRANPVTSKKLTRAHKKACLWIQKNPEEAVKILQENNWAVGDAALVLSILKTLNYDISDEQTEETLRHIIRDYQGFGILDPRLEPEQILTKIWEPVLQHD